MKRASLGQLALKGGTTLNQLPIGLHVKILNFNGRLKPIRQHFECFLGINRFRIDENLTYVSMFG